MLALVAARSKVGAQAKEGGLVLGDGARARLFPGGSVRLGYPVLSRLRAGDFVEIPLEDLAALVVELKRIARDLERDAELGAFRAALLALVEKTRFDGRNLYAFAKEPPPPPGAPAKR